MESNSTDGISRDRPRRSKARPGVRLILQGRAAGKGNAVREALAAATGTIVLIQDADFEYDLDDYDALLEPIAAAAHRASCSDRAQPRSGRLEGPAVRALARQGLPDELRAGGVRPDLQRAVPAAVTDINTMFKVFRRECIEGIALPRATASTSTSSWCARSFATVSARSRCR